MKPLPSRLKIALLSAAISGVVLVAFGAVMWFLVSEQRLATVDREIRTFGSRHPGLFAGRGNFERLAGSLEFIYGEDYTNHVLLLLKDASHRILYSTPHWPKELGPEQLNLELEPDPSALPHTHPPASSGALRSGSGVGRGGMGRGFGMGQGGPPGPVFTKTPKFFTFKTGEAAWRVGVLGNDHLTLVIGLNLKEAHGDLNHLRQAFLLTLPVALFLVGLGGWVVAGHAMRPLKTIADTAERITARGLDQRIPTVSESPEAARVILVFNRMMDRLETSFRQATRFSADASHELKTPLAVMQGELENALQAAQPGSPEQQLFSNLLEETQRLSVITRSLLLLAQADAGQLQLALAPVDLSAEVEAMLEDARVLAAETRLAFEVDIQPAVRLEADRALLHTALFNLILNAIKHNEPDGKISVRLSAANHKAIFTIGNSGPGIPPADQPKIFERFYRVARTGPSYKEGIGLGLSLAREIIRAHGGELSLQESRTGWTVFTALLPANGVARPG